MTLFPIATDLNNSTIQTQTPVNSGGNETLTNPVLRYQLYPITKNSVKWFLSRRFFNDLILKGLSLSLANLHLNLSID